MKKHFKDQDNFLAEKPNMISAQKARGTQIQLKTIVSSNLLSVGLRDNRCTFKNKYFLLLNGVEVKKQQMLGANNAGTATIEMFIKYNLQIQGKYWLSI